MRRIGIRELRQNASQYIRLVKAGETIEVTERGVPVAVLMPCQTDQQSESTYDRLVREGKIREGTQDWASLKPVPPLAGAPSSQVILDELREDRF